MINELYSGHGNCELAVRVVPEKTVTFRSLDFQKGICPGLRLRALVSLRLRFLPGLLGRPRLGGRLRYPVHGEYPAIGGAQVEHRSSPLDLTARRPHCSSCFDHSEVEGKAVGDGLVQGLTEHQGSRVGDLELHGDHCGDALAH